MIGGGTEQGDERVRGQEGRRSNKSRPGRWLSRGLLCHRDSSLPRSHSSGGAVVGGRGVGGSDPAILSLCSGLGSISPSEAQLPGLFHS